jgi:hypothetical protein
MFCKKFQKLIIFHKFGGELKKEKGVLVEGMKVGRKMFNLKVR